LPGFASSTTHNAFPFMIFILLFRLSIALTSKPVY
jgi:hypothetical protein